MDRSAYILEFDHVTVRPDSHLVAGLHDVSFALAAGEIGVVEVEEGREHVPLADAAEGMIVPDEGCVSFMGERWEEMGFHAQAERRGRIRRVFQHYGWISNLDVMENIGLAERHHTHRSEHDIIDEARNLARRFGLEDIPDERPSRVHGLTLRKLEWVRALMGRPALLILERPSFGAPRADAPLLIEAVIEEARRGVAVLWVTDEARVCECRDFGRVKRFKMDGARLRALSTEGA